MEGVAMSQTIEKPSDISLGNTQTEHWLVVVFNNEHNTYDEVIMILMIATQCSLQEAEIETWEIDHLGKSVVHHGGQDECEKIATVIRQIGIKVEVISE
jgi:ATP-dependent Clp protease adapter protein ClpS